MSMAMTRMMGATLVAATMLAAGLVARANEAQRPQRVGVPRPAVLTCFDAPIDELTLGSDYTVFMRNDCPEWVRQAALRRLWTRLPPAEVPENGAI
jgi:hypothetical protein